MKKQNLFLTSVLTIAISCPAMADIAANAQSAKCDNGVLGTYEGSSNLQAQWNANTIYLNWYTDSESNNGSEISVTGTNAASCLYDGAISLPTQPTKTGYEFAGWRVRTSVSGGGNNNQSETPTPSEPEEPVSTCDISNFTSEIRGKDVSGVYNDSDDVLWQVQYLIDNGRTIEAYGTARCMPQNGGYGDVINESQIEGDDSIDRTCWCYVEHLINDETGDYCNFEEGRYVSTGDVYEEFYKEDEYCDGVHCAALCQDLIVEDESFADVIFGQK